MKLASLLFIFSLVGLALTPGCSSSHPAARTKDACGTVGATDCELSQSIKGDAFSTKLKDYLVANVSGNDGFEFWCKKKEGAETKLLSVRAYKVLSAKDSKLLNGKWFTVQIESSTQGGTPIIKDWWIGMSQEVDTTPCVGDILDPAKNQN